MSDLFEVLKQKYKHLDQGKALFINAGNKALRLELPSIGMEFTSDVDIGKDLAGFLYYNHTDNFLGRNVKFQCSRYISPYDNKACAWIKFYISSIDRCLAEFLAYDPEEIVRASDMDGWTSSGEWKALDLGSATAFLYKSPDSQTLAVSVSTIHKEAVINDSENLLGGEWVGLKGTLFFKDLRKVNQGYYASYNNDRIVFYESSWNSKDFTAYFIPYDLSENRLRVASARTIEFSGIVWSDT
ncbi:hypothetical protein FRC01_004316 [Tulasnella sp. 417]|nr:hypothetical protein FRC01_004316 [Tulasnella sp. 417]